MCPLKNIVLLCLSQEEMISFWFYVFLREVMVRPLRSVIIRAWNLMRATQASALTPGKCLELHVTILLILWLQYGVRMHRMPRSTIFAEICGIQQSTLYELLYPIMQCYGLDFPFPK